MSTREDKIAEAINSHIEHYRTTKTRPSWTVLQALRGLVMLSPLGALVVSEEEKKIFDAVWARRDEWRNQEEDAAPVIVQ